MTGTAGKLEFKQGGTASGTINAENATFKIGADYAVDGDLITSSGTTWDLGTSNLDLSGGTLELGGNVVLDNIITNNHTNFELAEDATVTRSAGFTLGGVDFADYTFTLGSATTDLTLEFSDSSGSQSNEGSTGGQTNEGSTGDQTSSGSPPGTLATQAAES